MEKRSQFWCTGVLRSNKLGDIYDKNFTSFNQNLVLNLMNLVLSYKSKEEKLKKWLKQKPSSKPHICEIRCLWVNKQVKNTQGLSKENPFDIF